MKLLCAMAFKTNTVLQTLRFILADIWYSTNLRFFHRYIFYSEFKDASAIAVIHLVQRYKRRTFQSPSAYHDVFESFLGEIVTNLNFLIAFFS